jgi:energy-coupling factor transport system permease protein
MIFGRFIPGDSIVHKLDPRTKLLGTFAFLLVIFLANNFWSYGLLIVLVLLAVACSKINFLFFLKGLRPMLLLIFLTVFLQVFFTQGGVEYFHWKFLHLTSQGLVSGLFILTRFMLIIFISTLMTLSTQPLALSDAVEFLLKPLAKIKFPVHEVGLMLSIALRFVPTLMDETEKIMKAQRSRGVNFNEGNLWKRLKALIPILIPLFVSAFKRADELAIAMEARGYQGGDGRSKYRVLQWKIPDFGVLIIFLVLLILLFLVRS